MAFLTFPIPLSSGEWEIPLVSYGCLAIATGRDNELPGYVLFFFSPELVGLTFSFFFLGPRGVSIAYDAELICSRVSPFSLPLREILRWSPPPARTDERRPRSPPAGKTG